jgi:hypothetical protein
MACKIDSLTADQQAALIAYRAEWLAHGRSCAPADRGATARVLTAMYAAINEAPPYVWWCDGPAVGSLVRGVLWANLWDNLGADLGDNLWANLRANLGANLGDNLRANLGANLWDNLWANLRDNLGANLGANLGDNLGANLGDNLWANLRDNLGANLGWFFWGQHEAAWPAYYAWPDLALHQMHTAEQRERLGWWLTLAQSCGWWQPYRGVVFVCERPARQAVDADGRLHHESGPALLCRDGWPVYAWHGVRVPAHVIEQPDTLTPEEIRAESNAEVRRVMIERMGWERWLQASGATPVQSDRFGDLYRTEMDGAQVGVVVVVNSTPEPDGHHKKYALLVPPEHETAHGAIASTFGLTAAQYQPVVET